MFSKIVFTATLLLSFAGREASAAKPPSADSKAPSFSGLEALNFAKRATNFGERSAGSPANERQRGWILSVLHNLGGKFETDTFPAQTPDGPVTMSNLVLTFPGTTGRAIVVSGHYDTKKIAGIRFVGANDGGSSTGFLVEFARVASRIPHADDLVIVFFDGEEAVREWSATDSCYGSRHLAAQWLANGQLKKVRALINVDMIGDRELDLVDDLNSSRTLRSLAQAAAVRLRQPHLFAMQSGMDDDHRPFAELGTEVLDLIDFDYGPDNRWWHKADDTADKLGAKSFQVVGDLVTELVKDLDNGKQ